MDPDTSGSGGTGDDLSSMVDSVDDDETPVDLQDVTVHLESVLLNLSVATDARSTMGAVDVELVTAVLESSIDVIKVTKNVTKGIAQSFIDTASDLMEVAESSLETARKKNRTKLTGSVG